MGELIDKLRVAESFSKAASTYDSVAALQRNIGHQLLEMLSSHSQDSQSGHTEPASILDLGCGTGYFTSVLRDRYPDRPLAGLDIASGMLAYARTTRALDNDVTWICGDAESLPLKNQSYSLVFSSLAIQWCENSSMLFAEMSRVLSRDGIACIATLGPQTLCELRDAWSRIDDYQHVNQFQSLAQLCKALPDDLELIETECEMRVLHYPQLKELTCELKGIGAHNMNAGQAKGLTGPARVKAFKAAYELFRTSEGLLPASYEVYYLILRKR
ncbi:malonyl-ACP O-methyltransferase BioC [Neptunomonas antarctica]|uniref:Malonyl-[acyl-carrier protein] O-methyltransferase n=1 Tax=Neptunomonas antarctica TaxID=619304 RepID=A0A1N7JFZ8_9GAMM|nr:malonyl-ACP O-methyltransferase BioC [Neptunomonas antarctica]SIS48174.1 malonyl-CoA O-methyltransferase [Neptunomonas antarctica]